VSRRRTGRRTGGWDSSAFAALPAETRAAVMAGTAVERGRGFLELEAAAELVRAPATCTCT